MTDEYDAYRERARLFREIDRAFWLGVIEGGMYGAGLTTLFFLFAGLFL